MKWYNYHLKVDCSNLKICTINLKAVNNITHQIVPANDTKNKKIKWNHKKNYFMPKEAGKESEGNNRQVGNEWENVGFKTNHMNIYTKCKYSKYIF